MHIHLIIETNAVFLEQAVQMMLICVVEFDFLMEKASSLQPADVNL